MINGLRTNNFRKLESLNINFVEGTNLIFGENAQGKTTVYEAIRFALFGTRATSGTGDSLTTWGKGGMWVELDIDGYTIRRTVANCKITNTIDGETVASGNSPSAKLVEQLLGCSMKDFDLLYMSKQGETAGLITFGATELNRKVEEYAGVDLIDKVIKKIGSTAHGLATAVESFEVEPVATMTADLKTLATEGMKVKISLDAATVAKTDIETSQQRELAELNTASAFNTDQQTIEKKLQRYNLATATWKATNDELGNSLSEAQDQLSKVTPPDLNRSNSMDESLVIVSKANKTLLSLTPTCDLTATLKEINGKVQEEADYKVALAEAKLPIEKAEEQLELAKDFRDEKQREVSRFKQLASDGICSSCERPMENHDPKVAEEFLSEAREAYLASVKAFNDASLVYTNCKNDLDAVYSTNPGTGWAAKAEKVSGELELVKTERVRVEGILASNENEDSLRKMIGDLAEGARTYERARNAAEKADQRYNKHQEEVMDGKPTVAPQPLIDTTEITARISQLNTESFAASTKVSELSAKRSELQTEYKGLKANIESAELNNAKAAELSKSLFNHRKLHKHLTDERVKFMGGVWRTILGTATSFISRSTSGWITEIGRNDKGDFTFTEDGIEAIAKESASGAQKAFIGTAIKVGLAQAKMGTNSMVLLDEPTADMREDKASQLAAGLMTLSGQKIMITHRDSERMVAQNIIHIGE